MRPTTLSVDARYRAHVVGALIKAMSEAARDAVYRADDHDAPFPQIVKEDQFDPEASGLLVFTLHVEPDHQPAVPDVEHYKRLGIPRPDEKADRP